MAVAASDGQRSWKWSGSMKIFSNRAFFGFALVASLVFTSCGGSSPSDSGGGSSSASAASTSYGTGALQLDSFSPPAGTYASLPTQIQVAFNESNLNPTTMDNAYYWSLTCSNSQTYYPRARPSPPAAPTWLFSVFNRTSNSFRSEAPARSMRRRRCPIPTTSRLERR